jgi:GTPase-activating protein BEM2
MMIVVRVTDFEENNQMTADSLSTVFSPNLIRAADDDVGFFFANISKAHKATKLLITHVCLAPLILVPWLIFHSQAHIIFNDVEPDLDADHEGDSEDEYEHYDAPILEEDEEAAELGSAEADAREEEDSETQTVVAAPPVLDFSLPSPCDLSIPMPS